LSHYPYTIPSREDILGILRSADTPQDTDSIAQALGVDEKKREGLTRRLNAMERDGQIKPGRGGHFELAQTANFIEGRVSSHRDGYGFLIPDEGGDDLFLSEKEMQKVLHGDRVKARLAGTDRRGRPEGSIVEVVERANTHVIGRLLNENGAWIIAPEDQRISQDILLSGSPGKAKAGQVVSVELVEQPSRFTQPVGRLVEVLGDIDDPGMEIEIAVRKYGVPHEFSEEAKAQAARLPGEVRAADLANRVDLRDVPLVTIDGEDARDFDDAVYCEPVKVGRSKAFRMIVAIADVSHYVKPQDALDHDALERSTSVYFPRRVIPMLPEKLSNGLCSLNPGVDRLTLVCDAVITAKGEVTAYQFYPAVIHSAARLTYTEVAAILANTRGTEAAKRTDLVPHLQNLYALYHALQKARQARGAIDFDTTETYIVVNAAGKIEQILPRTRNDAHRLIEECMLAANVCAADLLERSEHPGVFRVHAGPTEEKLNQVRTFLKQHGLNLGGGDNPTASDYAELMGQVKLRPDAMLLQTMLLRSMQQAVYSPENIGHFGLSYEAYAHFTSPIRRYPDLLTHRAIKAILQGKRYNPKGFDASGLNTTLSPAGRRKQALDKAKGKKKHEGEMAVWEALGIHCSANERRADEASRDVEAWLKCYFIRDKLGEEFSGTISGIAPFGIFVQLDSLFIEGMVHVTELGADYFQYDEARHELRGERTGIRYQLTDRVTVQVSRVDLDARKIDLRLVSEPGIKTQLRNEARRADTEHQGRGRKAALLSPLPVAVNAPAEPAPGAVWSGGGAVEGGGNSSGSGSGKKRTRAAESAAAPKRAANGHGKAGKAAKAAKSTNSTKAANAAKPAKPAKTARTARKSK
jgi:ribonuclease R